jgi:hypothetical protein
MEKESGVAGLKDESEGRYGWATDRAMAQCPRRAWKLSATFCSAFLVGDKVVVGDGYAWMLLKSLLP